MPKVSIQSANPANASAMGIGTAGASFGYSFGPAGQSTVESSFGNFLRNPTNATAEVFSQQLGSRFGPEFSGFSRQNPGGPGSASMATESMTLRRLMRGLGSGEAFGLLPKSNRRDFSQLIQSGSFEGSAISQGIMVQGIGTNQKLSEISGLLKQILQVDKAELGAITAGSPTTAAAMSIGANAAAALASPAAAIGAAPAFVPPSLTSPAFVPPNIAFPNWPTATGGGGRGGGRSPPPPVVPAAPAGSGGAGGGRTLAGARQNTAKWGQFWAARHALTQMGRLPGVGNALSAGLDIGELGYAAGMSVVGAGALGAGVAGAIAAFNPNYIGAALLQSAMSGAQPYTAFAGNVNTLALGLGNATSNFGRVEGFYGSSNNQDMLAQLGLSPQSAAALAIQSPLMGRNLSMMYGFNYVQARAMINQRLVPGLQNLSPNMLTNTFNQQLIYGGPSGLNIGGQNQLSILSTLAGGVTPGLYPGAITNSVNTLSDQTAAIGGGINLPSLVGFSSAVQRSGFAGAQTGQMQSQIASIFQNSYQNAFGNPFTAQTMIFGLRGITTKEGLDNALGLTDRDYAQDPGLNNAVSQYLAARRAGSPVAYGWFQRIMQLTTSNKTAQAFLARSGQSYLSTIAPNAPSYISQFLAPQFAGFGNNYSQFLGAGSFVYPNVGPMNIANQQGIGKAAGAFNVPQNLLTAVLLQEQGGNLLHPSKGWATSSAGAIGIGQVMPATAAGLLGMNWSTMSPAQKAQLQNQLATNDQLNMSLSAAYLSQLSGEFKGDTFKIAEAYVAGPSAVESNFKGWSAANITAVKQYATNVQEYYRQLNLGIGKVGVSQQTVSPTLKSIYKYQTQVGEQQLGSAQRVFSTLVPLFNQAAQLMQELANIEIKMAGEVQNAATAANNGSLIGHTTLHRNRLPSPSASSP